MYLCKPDDFFIMIRCSVPETIGGLKEYLLLNKPMTDITNLIISVRGRQVPDADNLDNYNKKVLILSNTVFPNHGGSVWSILGKR